LTGWLNSADIRVGGDRPWDLKVNDPRLFSRILAGGSLAVGEAYMDGWWDARSVDALMTRALRGGVDRRLPRLFEGWLALKNRLTNLQQGSGAFRVGNVHYDVGDDLYERMLDPRMIYTCGYWAHAHDVAAAQEAKLDLVGRKLRLEPGMRVLDIGCGWGGAAAYLADKFGVKVVGVTISRNQERAARNKCARRDVEIRFQDYRDVTGVFDRVYSLGMFEHVGIRNYEAYFAKAASLLRSDGLFLLHTIGNRYSRQSNDPWIEKYIFPNSQVPSHAQIARAVEREFVVEDWHEFGPDYDRTLMAWRNNFEQAWPTLAPRYGERFHRMWHYWLSVSAASFRARELHLWQVLLSPSGVPGGLAEVR
jgi:cyclopropane-fatty-acyl-phospholipid synthase